MGSEDRNRLIAVPKESIKRTVRLAVIGGQKSHFCYSFSAPPVCTAYWAPEDWDVYITQWYIR